LNNKELQTALAAKLEMSTSEVDLFLQSTVDAMVDQLKANKTINIQGFGSFEVRKKEERVTVNPLTKVRSMVPAKLSLAFKTSTVYKDKIKDLPRHE
jgi:DNA-binding protein HU-beta